MKNLDLEGTWDERSMLVPASRILAIVRLSRILTWSHLLFIPSWIFAVVLRTKMSGIWPTALISANV